MNAFVETQNNQRRAADPARSAIVAANAGSGKTRVLTDRVARLLLDGTPPSKILCITYTKAAAAEMASRLFRLLGGWALADDETLDAALKDLEGEGFRKRSGDELGRARKLFARALETPGGLKIQTIHSFCESVLKRFPVESGVAPGFSVIDEAAAAALASAAIDEAACEAGLAGAFDRLASRCDPPALRALLCGALSSHQKWDEARLAAGGWAELCKKCAAALGIDARLTIDDIIVAYLARIDVSKVRQAQTALTCGGKTCRKFAEGNIELFLVADSHLVKYEALRGFLLTQKGEARATLADSPAKDADPLADPYLRELQTAMLAAEDKLRAADNYADIAAFIAILEKAAAAYSRAKAARARLDYDDLVVRVDALFKTTAADWVRYKLDQGLDHILLDEAQDTSPGQWRVIEGPVDEFIAGLGAREERRTFFAVGDQKQSIYSFQGADAALFAEKQHDLGQMIAAVAPFENVPLTCSFRSTAPVLEFVDALFERAEVLEGVDSEILCHGLKREGAGGLVELWPRVPRPEQTQTNAWDAPLDAALPGDPAGILTGAIAGMVKDWLVRGEQLEARGRAIRPSDILILVQSRGPLFHETIRQLTMKGVPVAGADKLKLLEDAGVEDLFSYARAAVFSRDDLSLAEILRSPFFDIDEESLFDLAHGRKSSLWGALRARGDERPEWAQALREIEEARAIGLRDGAFAFFSHILETGAPSGRKRLFSRLGEASAEPVDELLRQALDYELSNPRSLQGFLVWAEKNAGEIKRDMEERADAARVMTVHGAKGLEAEIVFLIDGHRVPDPKKLGPLFFVKGSDGAAAPIFSVNMKKDSEAASAARADARRRAYEEYRRLLYVAATRAKDRLYICGLESGNERDPHKKDLREKSWHALAEDAFGAIEAAREIREAPWGGAVKRLQSRQTAAPDREDDRADENDFPPPAWLEKPAAFEAPPKILSPSTLADDAGARAEIPAFSPLRSAEAFLRGRVLHRLLELLPEAGPATRGTAADRLLVRLAPGIAEKERKLWREEALAVLDDPRFAPVFGANSRAEVGVAGVPKGARGGVGVSGQIDRLAVDGPRVLVVDYKTNRPPPVRLDDVPPAYVAQLAAYRALLQEIYPDKEIACALLWTYEARLMGIPKAMLDNAFETTLGAS